MRTLQRGRFIWSVWGNDFEHKDLSAKYTKGAKNKQVRYSINFVIFVYFVDR
jgi:hypothetical protein